MNIVDDIESKRAFGVVHCGYLSESSLLPAVASSFSLSQDVYRYRQIAETGALRILTRILHLDMAYDAEIMPLRTATMLSESFLQDFKDESSTFFTNIKYDSRRIGTTWNPVTKATFDAGVIAISKTQCACLWVEDED